MRLEILLYRQRGQPALYRTIYYYLIPDIITLRAYLSAMRHCIAAKFMVAIEEKIGSLDTRCTGAQFDYLIHEIAYVRIGNKLSASKLWWNVHTTIAVRLVLHYDRRHCVLYCLYIIT